MMVRLQCHYLRLSVLDALGDFHVASVDSVLRTRSHRTEAGHMFNSGKKTCLNEARNTYRPFQME